MTTLKNQLAYQYAQAVCATLENDSPELLDSLYSQVGEAPSLAMGHFALGLFPLAKTMQKNPAQISNEIAAKLQQNLPTGVKEIQAKGPYLNVFFQHDFLAKHVLSPFAAGSQFKTPLTEGSPKTMVEYSQPNTHKELHVGHMRNLCLGNSIVRILRHSGYPVISTTYPGDVGTHVAKCLWYLKNHNSEEAPSENKGAWLGRMYSKAHNLLEDQLGTEHEDKNRAELTTILKELHQGKGEFYEQWKTTKEWSLDQIKLAYQWADVDFDRWFFESEVDAPSVQFAHELKNKKLLIEDDGAIGMDLSDDKLGFCLMIKRDGTGLYATKDVELARLKFEEFGIEKSIYVVDNRQSHHFKQVFKVLEKIGFKQAKDCFHLAYEMVELKDGAMSSRQGNIISLMELIQKMQATITENYLEKYRGEWSDEEIITTAQMIANGAIKYGMIRVDNNRKIIFEMDEWLKLDGETGPYLQYVHARISSLLEKGAPLNWETLDHKQLSSQHEIGILLKLNQFNNVVLRCAQDLKTLHLCSYLYELGKMFNSFYADCSVLNAETPELKTARLGLCFGVQQTMQKGLELLGIQAPTKM